MYKYIMLITASCLMPVHAMDSARAHMKDEGKSEAQHAPLPGFMHSAAAQAAKFGHDVAIGVSAQVGAHIGIRLIDPLLDRILPSQEKEAAALQLRQLLLELNEREHELKKKQYKAKAEACRDLKQLFDEQINTTIDEEKKKELQQELAQIMLQCRTLTQQRAFQTVE